MLTQMQPSDVPEYMFTQVPPAGTRVIKNKNAGNTEIRDSPIKPNVAFRQIELTRLYFVGIVLGTCEHICSRPIKKHQRT